MLVETKQQIIRNTLKYTEEQLQPKQFIRCHKSYIVNKEKIVFIKGNLKDLKLRLAGLDFDIPVSRNLPKEVYNLMTVRKYL